MKPIKITPLGGLGETGALNCMLYETADTAVIVDCGVAFADTHFPGVNIIIPDFSFLNPYKDKLKAIILTHGHEDHIGALPYLVRKLPLPVYAGDFTRGLVHSKFAEFGIRNVEVKNLDYNKVYQIGDFKVDPVFVNHSIMDACHLYISNDDFKILHGSDYKIDHSAPENRVIDLARFKKIGEAGLDLLLLDSTNALHKGWTRSESKVRANLLEVFTKRQGRIVTCLFSSNSFRVQSLLECARITGRKVALTGRSSKEYFRIAYGLGRMDIAGVDMYDVEDLAGFKDEEILVIVTGSQAEPRSVLNRISNDMFRPFKIKEGDTVLMSSRMIPGNEGRIWDMLNRLALLGAEIVNDGVEPPVHASGHAFEDELREIMRLTKPKHFIPIHGESRALKRHVEIACEEGVPRLNTLVAMDGDTVELCAEGLYFTDHRDVGRTYISENSDYTISEEAIRRRNKMAWNGVVAVSVIYDHSSGSLKSPVQIFSEGIFGGDTEQAARTQLTAFLARRLKKDPCVDADLLQKFFKIEVRHFFKAHYQIRPEVMVLIHGI